MRASGLTGDCEIEFKRCSRLVIKVLSGMDLAQ